MDKNEENWTISTNKLGQYGQTWKIWTKYDNLDKL